MRKIISAALAVLLTAALASCGTPAGPAVVSPKEYDALNRERLSPLLVSGILFDPWKDADEIEPSYFVSYYAAALTGSESGDFMDENGYIPADELEAMVEGRFDVTAERLRESEYYDAALMAYEFGGLGSAADAAVTFAETNGNHMIIEYVITGPSDFPISTGLLEIDTGDGGFRYLENRIKRTPQHHLEFPNSTDAVDRRGVLIMGSGSGRTGRGDDPENMTWYDGEELPGIIAFYEDEALPALEAKGEADAAKHEDGWFWSGTYRDGKPLTIDVRRQFGSDAYVIAAAYEQREDSDLAEYLWDDFLQPPDLNNLDGLSRYLRPLRDAGLLDEAWENKDPDAEPREERTEAVRVVSATSYGRGEDGAVRIALGYEVTGSDESDAVLHSGEALIELSDSGYRYLSNTIGGDAAGGSPPRDDPAGEDARPDYEYYDDLSEDERRLLERVMEKHGLNEAQVHSLGNRGYTFEEMLALATEEVERTLAPGSSYMGDYMSEEELAMLVGSGLSEERANTLMALGYDYYSAAALTPEQLDFIFPTTELVDHLVAAGYDRDIVWGAGVLAVEGGYDTYKDLLDEVFETYAPREN